ncbi:hypothetical protein [Rhizobium jaguaris]|uniref:Uncharacterized protein n=1 Tax=Rhizobium jaguaris TaxID=1312183 RepID=A0A387FRJ4_9HYPH|nr:hypothetical protein [Rhizobium jaguaris]AYG61930.1 hypothetical protein CCGE525_24005 [Rhizobium jaguaris]
MLSGNLAFVALLAGGFCFAAGAALAQDEHTKPHHVPLQKTIGTVTPTGPVPSLAVINATGATLENNKLTLTGVSPNSILFADRPVRAAGHVATEQFIMQWDEGKNNFAKDPPNATVSVLGGDGSEVSDAVVTLKSPKIEGNNLTFEVSILEDSLNGSSGPAAVFIDDFSSGSIGTGETRGDEEGDRAGYAQTRNTDVGHHGSYWHAPVYHGAWYASTLPSIASEAAIGAEDPRPYYDNDTTCIDTPFQVCY